MRRRNIRPCAGLRKTTAGFLPSVTICRSVRRFGSEPKSRDGRSRLWRPPRSADDASVRRTSKLLVSPLVRTRSRRPLRQLSGTPHIRCSDRGLRRPAAHRHRRLAGRVHEALRKRAGPSSGEVGHDFTVGVVLPRAIGRLEAQARPKLIGTSTPQPTILPCPWRSSR
jgi:hypothetical protein